MGTYPNRIKPSESLVKDIGIFFYGDLPRRKSVYIATSSQSSPETIKGLYSSVVEASQMGWDILYIPGGDCGKAVEEGCFDGEGRLHAVLPFGLLNYSRRSIRNALVYSGSVISPYDGLRNFTLEGLDKARIIASSLADIIFIGQENILSSKVGWYIEDSLDEGKDIALLKSCMGTRYINDLVKEGCPAVSSFSDIFSSPTCFLYPSSKGRYGHNGFTFDIIEYGY